MSSKKKNNKNNEQAHIEVQPQGNILEAESVTIMPIMKDFQLSQLNNTLVLQYFKEISAGQIIEKSQNISFTLYGRKQHFKIINISSFKQQQQEQDEDQNENDQPKKFLITKKSTLKMVQYQQTEQKNSNENDQQQQENQNDQNQNKEVIVLAGMDIFEQQLQNHIKMAIYKQDKFESLGFPALKGILLTGPSGTGKTKLVKKVAQKLESDIKPYLIECKSLLQRVVGEGEKKLEGIFETAAQNAPSLIFFDDLHIIASKKDNNSKTMIATLAAEIDKITPKSKIVVIAATNNDKKLDEQLKRAGRFDKEIKIDIPKASDRLQIFKAYMQKIDHKMSDQDMQDINYQMNGFTGADIVSLLREAILQNTQQEEEREEQEGNDNDNLLKKKDFETALQEIQPSGIKEILMDIPKVYWKDIGGYSHVKDEIKKVTEWPLKHPEAFTRMGIAPSKGILLYGPPGCSKTMIAKAIATESKLNFLAVKGPELFSKYVGDSEKAVRDVFRRARLCAPSVIFFDEIDAIATQRSINTDVSERVLCQMLNEMDGIEGLKGVVIIAATNRPEIIDKALTRPGRFDHLIYVPPPSIENRLDILKINVYGNKMPVEDNLDLNKIAFLTEGYSGAEMCLICREAGLAALSRDIHCEKVTQQDFEKSLQKIKPRITQEMITQYTNFERNQKLF